MATRTALLDYYEILGLPRDADQADIEAAFRSETLKIRDLPGSGERTRRLGLAYRALSNPERRRDYDAALSGVAAPALDDTVAPTYETATPPPSEQIPLVDDDDEAPARRGWNKGLLAGLAAVLLVLLVGAFWSAGQFGNDTKVADRAPEAQTTARGDADREEPAVQDEDGGITDALASLLPGGNAPEDSSVQPSAEAPVVASADGAPASPATGTGEVTPPPSVARDESRPEAVAAAQPQVVAEPVPVRQTEAPGAEPPPPPAPAIDRSAGPRLVSGGLVDADNQGGRFQGSVSVRLRVSANGRAQACSVTRSSGNNALDSTTCRLLQERLVFNPARDRVGNPIATEVESTHVWGRQRRR